MNYPFPVFPFEIIELISTHLVDSRPVYLTNRRLLDSSPDRVYWESRGDDRIRTLLPKIPTDLTLEDFAIHGNLQMVRYLHSLGADVTSKNNWPLQSASQWGHLPVVEFLHSVGAGITDDDNYAIRWASMKGHLPVVKFLHSVGADITSDDNYAILWASCNGHLEVVEFLLSVGATLS